MNENKSCFRLPCAIVLMYHRISKVEIDPWNICVSPQHFKQQIQFLKNTFNIISTTELIQRVKTNRITKNTVCITFDDGYADNYIAAKSILEKYNCPATFFVPTAFINETKSFWWDELETILLHSKKLPFYLLLEINDKKYEYLFDETELSSAQYNQHTRWKCYDVPPTQRCKIFLSIWEKFRPLSNRELKNQITRLKEWAGINQANNNRLPMNEQQLQELSKNDLFTIGLHTHTHIDLKGKQKNIQLEEIAASKKILADKYHIQCNALAYPYGNYDNTTIDAIEQLNIDHCFTTEAIIIDADTDLYRLGRYQVCDWNIKDFKNNLDMWFNDDALKI